LWPVQSLCRKTDPCSGNAHQVTILWQRADGYNFNSKRPEKAGTVCDGHMQAFIELGQREGFQYTIVEDEVIGEIEGKPSAKEKE